jgi:branched-chain amino acid transport system ATP-binding protein
MLEIRGIAAGYDRGPDILDDVSVTVPEGQIVALLGANGAGKSTTLRTVAGLLRARRGRIALSGRDLAGLPPHQVNAAGITMVPEGRRLFPYLTVEENLLMGAFRRRDRKQIATDIERMYDRFPKLAARRRQMAGSMSGGEQQMCAMARALMTRPKILLLDEPSLGLAPQLVEAVFDLIREIKEEGMSVLLVEQNAHHALDLADAAYVLQNGRIVVEGSSVEVRGNADVRKAYLGR